MTKWTKEYKKEYNKEYYQRPEVKERMKEYYHRPEVKERRKEYKKEYNKRPEVKERRKEYMKEYHQRPEVKERRKERRNKAKKMVTSKELCLIECQTAQKVFKEMGYNPDFIPEFKKKVYKGLLEDEDEKSGL
jgi:hypothetical protein